jgi:peptide deformylase
MNHSRIRQNWSNPASQHPKIITDDFMMLKKKSDPIAEDESDVQIVEELIQVFNDIDALGLAAVQINIHKRVFIAKVLDKKFIFINPTLTCDHMLNHSQEGCLSLPGEVRKIERYRFVTIDAETIYDAENLSNVNGPFKLEGLDAFVIQHEMDHLDGTLITDHEEILTKKQEKHRKRYEELTKERKRRRTKPKPKIQVSDKRMKTLNKEMKRAIKWMKNSVEIQERYKSELENTD